MEASTISLQEETSNIINCIRFQKSVSKLLDKISNRENIKEKKAHFLSLDDANRIVAVFDKKINQNKYIEACICPELKRCAIQHREFLKSCLNELRMKEINAFRASNKEKSAKSKDSEKYPINASFHHIENEENASAAIDSGRVLGLLQKQKDMATQEIIDEHISHALLTEEIAESTHILKEATLKIRKTVIQQNVQLDSIDKHAEQNLHALEEQRKLMSERTRVMSIGFFLSIWYILMMIFFFTTTFLIIRLVPKP